MKHCFLGACVSLVKGQVDNMQMCIYILHSFLCAFEVVRLLQRWVYQRSLRTIGGWFSDAMLGYIRAAVTSALVATQCMGLGQSSGAAFFEEFQKDPASTA